MRILLTILVVLAASWLLLGIVIGGQWKEEADRLIISGKPAAAIEIYSQAIKFFPWRKDLVAGLEGAKLVALSRQHYEEVTTLFGEFQEIPSISQLHRIELGPNEIFVPMLMYHHIRLNPRPSDPVWAALNVTPENLEAQLAYLKDHGFTTITLSDLLAGFTNHNSLPSKPIILTFDDSYQNFYTNAFPILKKYRAKSVQFVVTAEIGNNTDYLTWEEIVEMDRSGLVQFGAHTQHHVNLPDYPAAQEKTEIFGSKADLEKHLGKPTDFFAYPYGSYNQAVLKMVKEAGFKAAVSTVYGPIQSPDKIYLLPRIMVDGRFSLDNLARRIEY